MCSSRKSWFIAARNTSNTTESRPTAIAYTFLGRPCVETQRVHKRTPRGVGGFPSPPQTVSISGLVRFASLPSATIYKQELIPAGSFLTATAPRRCRNRIDAQFKVMRMIACVGLRLAHSAAQLKGPGAYVWTCTPTSASLDANLVVIRRREYSSAKIILSSKPLHRESIPNLEHMSHNSPDSNEKKKKKKETTQHLSTIDPASTRVMSGQWRSALIKSD